MLRSNQLVMLKNSTPYRGRTVRRGGLSGQRRFALWLTALSAIICLSAAAGYGGYTLLTRIGIFRVAAVHIEGCERVDKDTVEGLSGINIHTDLLSLDTAAMAQRITANEWIKSAGVMRQWPNTVIITVQERVPVALLQEGQTLRYVDAGGTPFAVVGPADDLDFPVICGAREDNGAIQDAVTFLLQAKNGSSVLPRQNISQVVLAEDGKLTVYLVNRPFPIYLGKGDMRRKYSRLARVLRRLYKHREFAKTAYIRFDYLPDQVLVGKAG